MNYLRKYTILLSCLFVIFFFAGCAIQSAAASGNLADVKKEIAKGTKINAQDNNGNTALMEASMRGHFNIVKYLVSKGADVNLGNNARYTALMDASRYGQLTIVKYLLDNGAQKDLKSGYGNTAFSIALQSKKFNVTDHFIEKYDDIDLKNEYDKMIRFNLPKSAKYLEKKLNIVKIKEKKTKTISERDKVKTFIVKNDLQGLKKYTDKKPHVVNYIKNDSLRLLLTGPQDLKVGDIKKYIKEGTSEVLIVSLIKRVQEPYKQFNMKEIKLLQSMSFSDKIISTMIDVTTKLFDNNQRKKEQYLFLENQKKINNVQQNTSTNYDDSSNKTFDKVGEIMIDKSVGKLLDKLF